MYYLEAEKDTKSLKLEEDVVELLSKSHPGNENSHGSDSEEETVYDNTKL